MSLRQNLWAWKDTDSMKRVLKSEFREDYDDDLAWALCFSREMHEIKTGRTGTLDGSYNIGPIMGQLRINKSDRIGFYRLDRTGRIQPQGGAILMKCRGEARANLILGTYRDIDMCNCHPQLLANLFSQDRVREEAKHFQEYLEHKSDIRALMSKECKVPLDVAKRELLAVLYGRTLDGKGKDGNRNPLKDNKWFKSYYKEVRGLTKKLIEAYFGKDGEVKAKARGAPKIPEGITGDHDINNWKMSAILNTAESAIMAEVWRFLEEERVECCLSYDGALVKAKKEENLEPLMRAIEKRVKDRTGFDVHFEEKKLGWTDPGRMTLPIQSAVASDTPMIEFTAAYLRDNIFYFDKGFHVRDGLGTTSIDERVLKDKIESTIRREVDSQLCAYKSFVERGLVKSVEEREEETYEEMARKGKNQGDKRFLRKDIFSKFNSILVATRLATIVKGATERLRYEVELEDPPGTFSWTNKRIVLFGPETRGPYATTAGKAIPTEELDLKEIEMIISQILPDEEVRDFFLKMCATALTGYRQILIPHLVGTGSNGKSLITSLLEKALGDYAIRITVEDLAEIKGASAPNPVIVKCDRKRLVLIPEVGAETVLKVSKLKALTGEPFIMGRNLYGQPVNARMNCTVMMTSNNQIPLTSVDYATRRRIVVVNFPSKFVSQKRIEELGGVGEAEKIDVYPEDPSLTDPDTMERLSASFLRYLVSNYIRKIVERDGTRIPIVPPQSVVDETAESLDEQDSVKNYVEEHLEKDENSIIKIKDVLQDYAKVVGKRVKQGEVIRSAIDLAKRLREILPGSVIERGQSYKGKQYWAPTLVGYRLSRRLFNGFFDEEDELAAEPPREIPRVAIPAGAESKERPMTADSDEEGEDECDTNCHYSTDSYSTISPYTPEEDTTPPTPSTSPH